MVSTSIQRNWWFYRLLFALVRPFTKSLVRIKPPLESAIYSYCCCCFLININLNIKKESLWKQQQRHKNARSLFTPHTPFRRLRVIVICFHSFVFFFFFSFLCSNRRQPQVSIVPLPMNWLALQGFTSTIVISVSQANCRKMRICKINCGR